MWCKEQILYLPLFLGYSTSAFRFYSDSAWKKTRNFWLENVKIYTSHCTHIIHTPPHRPGLSVTAALFARNAQNLWTLWIEWQTTSPQDPIIQQTKRWALVLCPGDPDCSEVPYLLSVCLYPSFSAMLRTSAFVGVQQKGSIINNTDGYPHGKLLAVKVQMRQALENCFPVMPSVKPGTWLLLLTSWECKKGYHLNFVLPRLATPVLKLTSLVLSSTGSTVPLLCQSAIYSTSSSKC